MKSTFNKFECNIKSLRLMFPINIGTDISKPTNLGISIGTGTTLYFHIFANIKYYLIRNVFLNIKQYRKFQIFNE